VRSGRIRLLFRDTPVAGVVVRVGEMGSRDIVGLMGDAVESANDDFEGPRSCKGETGGRE
jgi:hypothetical protein